jgi:hypothetical protein
MKAKKIYYLASVILIAGVVVCFSCKKDNTTTNGTIAATQLNEAQQSESNDAMADKVDQDIDNNLDNLESNGYSTSTGKSALADCVGITIDSTTQANGWPRNITFTYDCQDTINSEVISQMGTINVIVSRGAKTSGGYLYTRAITFTDYTVTIDSVSAFNLATSPSIKISGTRTVTRTSITPYLSSDKQQLRLVINDAIKSAMNFHINYGDTSITFTRNVDRTRTAYLHFRKPFHRWLNVIDEDTLTLTGPVTGINARGYTYTRNITTPLLFTFCTLWPHVLIISQGEIDLSNSSGAIGTITYAATGCKTTVTLTVNGKSKIINRRFGRKFHRWW